MYPVFAFVLSIFLLSAPAAFAQQTAKPFAAAMQQSGPAVPDAPDFSLAAPTALFMSAGKQAGITLSVEFINGFSGPVSLGATNLPPGVSASFSPASVSENDAVNVTFFAQPGTAGEMGNVTIFGVDGTDIHALSIALTVSSGSCLSANAVTLPRGGTIVDSIDLSCLQPNGPVTLEVTGVPVGVAASFNLTAGSGGLILSASNTAPLGAFTLELVAASGTSTLTIPIEVTIVSGTPVVGGTCHIGYEIVSEWDGMFEAVLSIDNTGAVPIPPGWALTWAFANGQTVFQLWNGTVTQSAANVTVQGDATIPVTGSDKGVGFLGTRLQGVPNQVPTAFALNGAPCTVN